MDPLTAPPNLLVIVGATATGKSDLAIEIAESAKAEIISADSVQFYRELIIGSARPSDRDLARVRHHFIGFTSIREEYTAGRFERAALDLINQHPEKLFIIVGGSGFYIQALLKGMYPIDRANPAVIAELEERADREGVQKLYAELLELDSEAARKIAPQDRYRIVRALEILKQLKPGQTLTEIKEEFAANSILRFTHPMGHREVVTLGLRLEKSDLEPRVKQRVERMMVEGLLEEVSALREAGLGACAPLQSVGYRECLLFLEGTLAEHELVPAIVQSTMRLAKKQRTWFARDPSTVWFDALHSRNQAREWGLQVLTPGS